MPERAIVLISSSFPLRGDGSEAAGGFVAELAEIMALHQPVRVVAPGIRAERERLGPRLEVFRFAAPAHPLSNLRPWHPGDALAILRVLRAGGEATARALEAGPTAHLLALWALPCGAWARSAARQGNLPYSIWALGSDIWSLSRIPIVRRVLRNVLRQAARRYADGISLAAQTEALCGLPVDFLPSARRPPERQAPAPQSAPPYRLLFLGRWHPNKGIDLLLEAVDELGEEDWKRIASLELAGDGPLAPRLHPAVERLRAAGRPVTCPGFLGRERALAALERADFVLIPSRIESIPLVFSDALAAGRPVVAMPVGDLPSLCREHRVGILAEEVTARAFRDALLQALRQGPWPFREGIARACQAFDLRRVADRLLAELKTS